MVNETNISALGKKTYQATFLHVHNKWATYTHDIFIFGTKWNTLRSYWMNNTMYERSLSICAWIECAKRAKTFKCEWKKRGSKYFRLLFVIVVFYRQPKISVRFSKAIFIIGVFLKTRNLQFLPTAESENRKLHQPQKGRFEECSVTSSRKRLKKSVLFLDRQLFNVYRNGKF